MQRVTRSLIALAIALTFATPAANATWYFAQSFEPSTAYDTAEWIWQDPPPLGESRIYFAAFSHHSFVYFNANPNLGLMHTQLETANSEAQSAVLGVWKDCNGDGYIGMAESAVREYAAVLLTSTEACPPVDGPAATWAAGAHNYNGWVSELVPIGRDPGTADRRIYEDDAVRIWGDYHRPDEDPWLRPCPLAPQPRGTYQSTGGMINFVDCRVDIIGVMNMGFDAIGDPLGWHISDPEDATTSPIGQVETFGDEDDANRAVTVWDCSSRTRVGDVINETSPELGATPGTNAVQNIDVFAPAPEVEDTSDPNLRVAGTVNHTMEGFDDCDTMGDGDDGGDLYEGVCVLYCVGEGDFNGIDPENKREAHFNLRFTTGARGTAPYSALAPLRWNGPSGPPGNHGVSWNPTTLSSTSSWAGTTFWLTKPGFGTVRTHLQDPTNDTIELAPGLWFTWYAYLGQATIDRGFALPGGQTGTYASWHCGGNDSGIHHGFNCDPDTWYVNPDGTPVDPQDLYGTAQELEAHELVRVGQTYHLRDVDCYDGTIRGTDPAGEELVGVQPAWYGEGACT